MQRITRRSDGKFVLQYPDGSADKLVDIPGLAIAREQCTGSVDQVSVAARRLGYEGLYPWPLPTTWQRDLGLGKTPFGDMYKYQKKGALWAADRCRDGSGVVIADDMGLGKSVECLAVCKLLQCDTVLVVCPASVRLTWEAQIERWCQHEPFILAEGAQAANLAGDQMPKYVVTSYELAKKLPSSYTPDAIILDEAHLLRGRKNERVKNLSELAAMASVRIATTGTPIWDRPRDWFMLLQILFRSRFGNSAAFDYAYCAGVPGQHGGIDNKGVSNPDELKHRISFYMLRRTKDEVGHELPPMSTQIHWLPPDKRASAAFRHCMLRQGTTYIEAAIEAAESKVQAAVERAADARSFFCVSWTKRHATEIHRQLNEEYDTPCYLITGEVSDKKRKALVALAAEKKHGIVATMDSVGTGFDGIQHVTQTGIMHTIHPVPNAIAQCMARLHRIGVGGAVQWHLLARKDSMDEKVVNTVVDKMDLGRAVMGQRNNEKLRNALADGSVVDDSALRQLYDSLSDEGDDGGK